jgi:hypothetical protein
VGRIRRLAIRHIQRLEAAPRSDFSKRRFLYSIAFDLLRRLKRLLLVIDYYMLLYPFIDFLRINEDFNQEH